MKTIVLSFLLLLIFPFQWVSAQTSYSSLQAAYLYNFAKYIAWPNEKERENFTIGVYGNSPLLDDLGALLEDKKIRGMEIEIKRITKADDAFKCQIVFLPSSRDKEFNKIIETINGKNTLLVTESDLAAAGAGISFVIKNDKLKFKLNQTAMKRQELEVCKGLIDLATAF